MIHFEIREYRDKSLLSCEHDLYNGTIPSSMVCTCSLLKCHVVSWQTNCDCKDWADMWYGQELVICAFLKTLTKGTVTPSTPSHNWPRTIFNILFRDMNINHPAAHVCEQFWSNVHCCWCPIKICSRTPVLVFFYPSAFWDCSTVWFSDIFQLNIIYHTQANVLVMCSLVLT